MYSSNKDSSVIDFSAVAPVRLAQSTISFSADTTNPGYDTLPKPWEFCTIKEMPRLYLNQSSGFQGDVINNNRGVSDFFFLIFLFCFFLISFVFAKGRKNIALMSNELFSSKSRQSIFFETTGKDFRNKFFLVLQYVIVVSVFFYIWLSNHIFHKDVEVEKFVIIFFSFFIMMFVYFGYKWISTWIISKIFFDDAKFDGWREFCSSMICLGGIVLFIPIVLLYYMPIVQGYDYVLVILYFFISRILIIYKSYVLFFPGIDRLHYLFLYLCTQEIIPLFLLYKSLVYVFNIVETTNLWI